MNPPSVEAQIDLFLSKYSPALEARLRESRARLSGLFSRGFELVYDNYNALVFAISPTTTSGDAFVSVAGYPRWVTLFFLDGATLDDPRGLLEGSGRRVRSIRLTEPSDINTPDIEALILQAAMPLKPAFLAAPPISTVVKSISGAQRARRPGQAAAKP